jgi:4-hydroxyphenylacetate 3-monooxygenase
MAGAMMKTGAQHIASLRDGRAVYIDGERVEDVTIHRAFRNSVATIGGLYDFQADPAHRALMQFETPEGGLANRIWQLPRSYGELVERRKALVAWTEQHAGYLGRGPDHVASCISGMYMGLDTFRAYDPKRAGALEDYYRYARDNNIYLCYVIINPQADRSKAASEQADPYLTAGVVDSDASGLTVRGAKMLATGGILANEVLVSCIQPLRPGDERYALTFTIPMNSKGLKILSRRSYEAAAPSVGDYPLASRFDENDAVIYFDDVRVPWDRVFVNQSIEMCQKQFFATPAHVYQNYQAMVRFSVKLRFLVGIAKRIADMNGIVQIPQVKEMLGQLAAEAAMVEALVIAMETKGADANGYFVPDRHTLYSALTLTQPLYGKVIGTVRELAGGGMIMLPSSVEDFRNPELAALIGKTQQSPNASSRERVKFYKLAWDAVGSEYGSRHAQYEMFYSGATFVTKGHSFRTYDWADAERLLDQMLGSYEMESSAVSARAAE